MMRKKRQGILSLSTVLALIITMLFLPVHSHAQEETPYSIWINDDTQQTFETINLAVAAAADGDVIHVQGDFTEHPEAVSGTVVGKNVILDIAGDTVMQGGLSDAEANPDTVPAASFDGIRLEGTARIQTSGQAVLSMRNFNTALTIAGHAVLTDGRYTFTNNIHGLLLQTLAESAVEGSGDRQNLVIRSTNSPDPVNSGNKKLKNATIIAESSLTSTGSGRYANGGGNGTWNFENVSYQSVNTWLYQASPVVRDSDVTFIGPASFGQSQMMTIEGDYLIENSTVTLDGNGRYIRNAILSHTGGDKEHPSRLINSTLNIQNAGGMGGYNLANANVDVIDSTINISRVGDFAMGANYRSYDSTNSIRFSFSGNSVVNTQAAGDGDAVGANPGTTNPTIVMGGSHKVYWDPANPSVGNTPVNDEANGSERLTLLTLADPSVTELRPLNNSYEPYTYPVATASDDGKKHVWVPAVKVTFSLDNSSAVFADGTTEKKVQRTARGYTLALVEGNEAVTEPSDANGAAFLGWFYKEASGVERAFDPEEVLRDDMAVYAKWDSKRLIYHNQSGRDHIAMLPSGDEVMTVYGYEEIVDADPAFAVAGKEFTGWTTQADGTGDVYNAGDMIRFAGDTDRVDLYARYTDSRYTVTFSANGGVFTDGSIFARVPEAFDLVRNEEGRIIRASLKEKALYGQKLRELLPSNVSHNDLKMTADTATRFGQQQKELYWYKSTEAATDDRIRFDDQVLWIFRTDGENPEITSDVTYYVGWTEDASIRTISAEDTLPADMWGRNPARTQPGEWVYPSDSGLSVTGAVNVAGIKTQIQQIQELYGPDIDPAEIILTELTSAFTTTLHIPEGIIIDPDRVRADQVSAFGMGECFRVTDVRQNGQEIVVTFSLVPGIRTFADLKKAVLSAGVSSPADKGSRADKEDTIYITIHGLSASPNVMKGGMLSAVGEVSGRFYSYATHAGQTYRFRFGWTGEQNEPGKDARTESGITYTWRVPVLVPLLLEGDILIDGNTEHADVHGMFAGADFAYTGKLDVTPIKRQITAEKDEYETDGNDASVVSVREVASAFTATLHVSDDVVIPDDLGIDDIKFNDGTLFRVSAVKVDQASHMIAVEMVLVKEYTRFMDLFYDVTAVDDELQIDVGRLHLADDLAPGTLVTTRGTVHGEFRGIGVNEAGREKPFYFTWDAIQKEGGEDAIQSDDDDRTIAFTIEVKERPEEPKEPNTPKEPQTPQEPKKPQEPEEPGRPPKTIVPGKSGVKQQKSAPLTGDQETLLLWSVMALAGMAAAYLAGRRKQKTDR